MSKQKPETQLNKPERNKGGRPTKEQQFQNAIAAKNSEALDKHLIRIRLELFDLIAQETEGSTKTADRARNITSLKNIYDIGKTVLDDLKREEAASTQQGDLLDKLLKEADDVTADMGWDDDD